MQKKSTKFESGILLNVEVSFFHKKHFASVIKTKKYSTVKQFATPTKVDS